VSGPRVIAIDGPAASGKSTVARELAQQLGFCWINSGAFYRALTWWVLQGANSAPENVVAVARLQSAGVTSEFRGNDACLLVDGVDPSGHLREAAVNASVSRVSQIPEAREIVGRELRRLASLRDCVVEGRDIGTCVFPETPCKFYVDASPEERARRRSADGETDRIAERDRLDSQRAVAPLFAASDAMVIDSTHLTVGQVIERVLARVAELGLLAEAR